MLTWTLPRWSKGSSRPHLYPVSLMTAGKIFTQSSTNGHHLSLPLLILFLSFIGSMDHLVPSPRTTLAAPPPPPTQSPRIVTVPQNASHNNLTGLVISKIEDTLTSMVEILAGGGDSLSMPYRSRTSPRQAHGVLRFPGSSVQEATKFG